MFTEGIARHYLGVFAILLMIASTGFAQESEPGGSSEVIQEMIRYNREIGDISGKARGLLNDPEGLEMLAKERPKIAEVAAHVARFVEMNPGDPGEIDMLVFLVFRGSDTIYGARAVDLLAERKLLDARAIWGVLESLGLTWSPAAERLFLRIIKESETPRQRGTAHYGYGIYLKIKAEQAERAKANPNYLSFLELLNAGTYAREVESAAPDALRAAALRQFRVAEEEYGDQPYHEGKSIGEVASAYAYELEKLSPAREGDGATAPEITGTDLDGVEFKLSEYRGKVIVLDFWGHWCGPCRAMYPKLRSLVEKYKERPFAVLGVNSDRNKADVTEPVKSGEITWRFFLDGGTSGPISTRWNIFQWPTMYIIDAKGVIRFKSPDSRDLEKIIEKLLREAEAK